MAVEIVAGKVVGMVGVLDTWKASPRLRDAVEHLYVLSLISRNSWIFTGKHLFLASNAPIVFVVVVVNPRRIAVKWSFRRVIISQNGTFSLGLFC